MNHVVFVHHETKRVDVYTRDGQGFSLVSFGSDERAALSLLGISLAVDEVYFDPLGPPERS